MDDYTIGSIKSQSQSSNKDDHLNMTNVSSREPSSYNLGGHVEGSRGTLDMRILFVNRSRSLSILTDSTLETGVAGTPRRVEIPVNADSPVMEPTEDRLPANSTPIGFPESSSGGITPSALLAADDKVKSVVDFPVHVTAREALADFVASEIHSFLMFMHLVLQYNPFDLILSFLVSAASTCFFYYYKDDSHHALQFNLNWTMLSIALIFPLTMTLTETFKRRESALVHLCNLKSNILALMIAHHDWDWYSIPTCKPEEPVLSGRADINSKEGGRLSPTHKTEVKACLCRLIDLMFTVLSAPRVSQAKNFYTVHGVRQRREVVSIIDALDDCVIALFHELSRFGEKFKAGGLPAGEKSRLTAFENTIFSTYSQLRSIKDYRSPGALRAFARVFIILTPLLFGPYYALVAESTNLAWAISFACLTTAGVQGLFNIRQSLEDPFTPTTRESEPKNPFTQLLLLAGDTINLDREFTSLKSDLSIILSDKPVSEIHRFFTQPSSN